jgi:pimeloyl-ACP methyl ester carboxylesterase
MRKSFLFLLGLLYAAGVSAQKSGPFEKPLQAFSKYYTENAPDSIYGMFNTQMKGQVTPESWRQLFPQIKESVGELEPFDLEQSGEIYNRFGAAGSKQSLVLLLVIDSNFQIAGLFNRPNKFVKPVYHTNYKVTVAGGELSGELLAPSGVAGRKPSVVLLIAGSGSTDRDGNNPLGVKAAPYKMLAEALLQNGIASFRYDKRFVGESGNFKGRTDSVRFEDFVNDAVACIRKLQADAAFSRVIVIGHSEGALIGAIAAREAKADRFVSLSGAGEPAGIILKKQFDRKFPNDSAGVAQQIAMLRKGNEIYVDSWASYDPAHEIGKLKMPVMIIQGLTDLQVSREDAEKLKAAAPGASLVFIDSMNHVLKDAPADQDRNVATYADDKLPLNKELVQTIVTFVKKEDKN